MRKNKVPEKLNFKREVPDDKPVWNEAGNPENLLAAALDAVEWLDALNSQFGDRIDDEQRVKLKDCIFHLQHHSKYCPF